MASREQPFSNPLDRAMGVLPERSAPTLAEKKAVTFGWMQFPAKRTGTSHALREKGRSFRLSFIFEGSQASKKRASPDWPIATPFLTCGRLHREWGGGRCWPIRAGQGWPMADGDQ